MELKIASFVLKPESEPIFSEQATVISIDDEAAGPFIVIRQSGRSDNSISLNFGEWEMLAEGIKRLEREWADEK